MSAPVPALLVACLLGGISTAQAPRSNPLYRGWLLETLQLDREGARAEFEAGTRSVDLDAKSKDLCIARLAEIELESRGPDAARKRLATLTIAPDDVELELPPAPDLSAARVALEAAWEVADPSRRASEVAAVRERLTAENRDAAPFANTIVSVVLEAYGSARPNPARDPLRRERGQRAGQLRAWIEVVEHHLEGRHAEADQLAWFAFRWRPQPLRSDASEFVDRGLARLGRVLETASEAAPQRAVLERLRARVQELRDRGDVAGAAELLRHVPLP